MKRFISVLALVCLLASMCGLSAFADEYLVKDQENFEKVIADAADGSTLKLYQGEYTLPVSTGGKSLTIIGAGADNTKISFPAGYEENINITFENVTVGDKPVSAKDKGGEQNQFKLTKGSAKSDATGGTWGGIDWTLTDDGTLTIKPTAGTPASDPNCGKTYEVGALREAVIYKEDGGADKIGGWPYDLSKVKSLVIEEGVTSIGSFALQNMPNLEGEVIIPSTVTYIGQEAFQNTPIEKLSFALGGTEPLCIGPGAFKNLNITELVLPYDRSEVHLHCWAFNDCKNLKDIILPANISTFSNWTHVDYCGMDYIDSYDSQIFARCWAMKNLTFRSEEVKNKFFAAPRNQNNIDSIGGVNITVDPDAGKPPKADPVVPAVSNPYSVPATGDMSNIPLWSVLLLGFALVAVLTRKREA